MLKQLLTCLTLFVILLCAAVRVQAQAAPYQAVDDIAIGATSSTWDVPAVTYGPLLSLQAYNLTNGATLAVKHLIPVTSSITLTNTVETAAAGGTLYVYPPGYESPQSVCTNTTLGTVITTTPVKPVYLVPGDKLLFTASAAHGSTSYIVIRAGFPGK